MASQLNSLRQDKEKLEAEKNEAAAEKEKMMEQIEALQQELVAAQQKPVAVAGVVHQQDKVGAGAAGRKQQQPHTHVQPQTRPQTVRETASIRPTVQVRPGPAVVLPSQVSSVAGQVDHVATVQRPSSGTSGTSTSAGTLMSYVLFI